MEARPTFMHMEPRFTRTLLAALLAAPFIANAQVAADLKAQLDAAVEEHFTPDAPGGVVLVAKGDQRAGEMTYTHAGPGEVHH